MMILSLFFLGFTLPAQPFEIGIAWQGQSSMTERVLRGMLDVVERQPNIVSDIRRDLPDRAVLENTISEFEKSKKAMVILRSNGAELLGQRGAAIPAFIGGTNNPVALGAAVSLDQPNVNITGVTYSLPVLFKLEAFQQIYPDMKKYLLLLEEGHPGSSIDAADTEEAAALLGLTGRAVYCRDLAAVLREVREADQDDVIILGLQALLMDNAAGIVAEAGDSLVFSYSERAVEAGALASIVPSDAALGRILGEMLVEHLIGGTPVDKIPIRTDPEPRLLLNYDAIERHKDHIPFIIRSLAETEKKYRNLVENAPVGIFRTRSEDKGRAESVNRTMANILGFETSEEAVNYYYDLGTQLYADPERRREFIRVIGETGRVDNFEYEAYTRDGRPIWLSMNARVTSPPGSDEIVLEGFTTDITERKKAEEILKDRTRLFFLGLGSFILILFFLIGRLMVSLRQRQGALTALAESEKRFKVFMDETPVYAYIKDQTLNHIYQNKRVSDLGKHFGKEKLYDSARSLFSAETVEILEKADRDILSGRADWLELEYEADIRGDKHWLHDIKFVLELHGSQRSVGGLAFDITAQKVAEKERVKLEGQLHQARKMESVGRLAGGVAHDFNNMLGVIIGYTEMALGSVPPGDRMQGQLQEVLEAAKRSADLTRQLLAFARKQTVEPRVMDLNAAVEGMLKMLRRLIGEDIELIWSPGLDLDLVKIDPSQIDQLLANLCVNARDAIAGVGEITIETSTAILDEACCAEHPELTPGKYVLLSFSDNGCGMEPETLEMLFEPFFTTKDRGSGTGLGLATVYGMVKQNNGHISVYSEINHGTTFNVYLPPCGEGVSDRQDMETEAPLEGGAETILLVEDDQAILRMTGEILEELGYRVLASRSPGVALSLAEKIKGRIDLLITDVIMPEMNGRELEEKLLSRYPGIKCLFMSGYTANVISRHGILEGGVHFIQKPFSIKTLSAKIREVLDSGAS